MKKFNPTSPGRRFQTVSDFADITTDKPHKPLLKASRKRREEETIVDGLLSGIEAAVTGEPFRIIDFKRDKTGDAGKGWNNRI